MSSYFRLGIEASSVKWIMTMQLGHARQPSDKPAQQSFSFRERERRASGTRKARESFECEKEQKKKKEYIFGFSCPKLSPAAQAAKQLVP